MADYTPKIGDIVVITKSDICWNSRGKMDPYVGKILKYIGGDSCSCFANMPSDMKEWSWKASNGHFRKATEQEEIYYYSNLGTLPKVGDTVILKEDKSWSPSMRETLRNTIATVTNVYTSTFSTAAGWSHLGYELATPADLVSGSSSSPSSLKEGDPYTVNGYKGVIKRCSEGYYWYSASENNGVIYLEKNLRRKEVCKTILGYYNSDSDDVFFKTIDDLLRVLNAIDTYHPGANPNVEFETKWSIYEVDGNVTICGQSGTIEKDNYEDYPYYINNIDDIDEIFEFVEKEEGKNRHELQESVLGYRDPDEYDSPQCASIRDLIKFWQEVEKIWAKRPIIDKSKVGESMYINGIEGKVRADSSGFEWYDSSWCSDTIFKDWDISKHEFQRSILGYVDETDNDFPYCKNYEDLLKFCVAIEERNNHLRRERSAPTSMAFHPTDFYHDMPYTLIGIKGKLYMSGSRHFWNNESGGNEVPFEVIGKDPRKFQREVLGYEDSGIFPECANVYDLRKFLDAIEGEYLLQKGRLPLETVESCEPERLHTETPAGTKIIFINVPKI